MNFRRLGPTLLLGQRGIASIHERICHNFSLIDNTFSSSYWRPFQLSQKNKIFRILIIINVLIKSYLNIYYKYVIIILSFVDFFKSFFIKQ